MSIGVQDPGADAAGDGDKRDGISSAFSVQADNCWITITFQPADETTVVFVDFM